MIKNMNDSPSTFLLLNRNAVYVPLFHQFIFFVGSNNEAVESIFQLANDVDSSRGESHRSNDYISIIFNSII